MIDTSIYNNLLRPPKSVAELDAEAMAGQQNKLSLMLSRQKADEYTRSVTDANQLRGVVSGFGADKGANYNALMQNGHLAEAQSYAKQNADIGKTTAESSHRAGQTQKDHFGVMKEANGMMGSAAGVIMNNPDPTHAAALVNELRTKFGPELSSQLGLDNLQIPQSPEELKQWASEHYTASIATDKQLDDARVKSEGVANRQNQTQISAANNAVQVRGQNVVASTAAASRAQSERHFNAAQESSKGQIVQADSGPVLVNTRTGTGQAINGPDGQPLQGITKPLNDSQSKALLFGTRMQEAHKVLGDLANSGTTSSVPGSRAPIIGGVVNAFSGENQQMLDQAKRDFINAVLRRESGAAIAPSEFDNGDKQYFPQIGDSTAVMAQKARNRDLAIKGVLVEVPSKQRDSITPKPQDAGVPADIAALLNKHGKK